MTGALTIQARREGDYTIVTVAGEMTSPPRLSCGRGYSS